MTTFVGSQHDENPYSAVVYIEATFSSGATYTGSGVMVGVNDVLTAAHVIFSEQDGGAATSITVFPGYNNGDAPFGEYRAAGFNYFEIDLDGDGLLSRFDSQTDVGIIGLSTALGNQTGWFSITTNATAGSYNLTGYPGVYEGAFGPRMTNDFGAVTVDPNYWVFNYTNIESNSGNSGGPLWFQGSSGPEVIGLASTGGWAVDLTYTYDEITTWITENDDLLAPEDIDFAAMLLASPLNTTGVVAATYQFFNGAIPTEGGFIYLIDSPENATDLSDPYYDSFNQENRYLNFAASLGLYGEEAADFQTEYAALSLEATIRQAYDEIIGFDEAIAAGNDIEEAIGFFLDAQPYYEAVARERVLPGDPDIGLDLATKVVAIGSILNEALKVDFGQYSTAYQNFINDILDDGEAQTNVSLLAAYGSDYGSIL